jgi:hypothetical protein
MLTPIHNPFSRYADGVEKKVDRVLWSISFTNIFETQQKMLALMQENLVVVNLWLEARFKGYKYLRKGVRKRMYRNAEKIAQIFLDFALNTPLDFEKITRDVLNIGARVPETREDIEKLRYIAAIMLFLAPARGRFEYLAGASFGKLLSDPDKGEKMIGDCNQIVTFYTYLYSLKYDIRELMIKLLEEHVCLHFKGIDIEATAGAFAKYDKYQNLLPIIELIPTNLLDVSDFRDKQIKVDPHHLLKAAHLADDLSSNKEIVRKNLVVAYHNVAIEALKANDFENAKFFAEKAAARLGEVSSGLPAPDIGRLLDTILRNAVIYYVKEKDFKKARYYLVQSGDGELKKYVDENEGFYWFNNGSLDRARAFFERIGNRQMVKACYAKEYNALHARVANLKLISDMKSHRSDYAKMLELARKMEDDTLTRNLQDILRQL